MSLDCTSPQGNDQLFRALIASSIDGIVVIDAEGRVELYNTSCERLFQYSAAEVLGRNVRMLMPEAQRAGHDKSLIRYRETGERRIVGKGRELEGQRKDCSVFPIYVSVGEGAWNEKTIFVAIIHDMTAMNAELAQREAGTRLLARIVQSSGDAVISKTPDGIITSWNEAAERLFGHYAQDAIGQHISLIIPPDRWQEEQEILAKIAAGQAIEHYETLRLSKDGAAIHVSISVAPIRNAAGAVIGASKIARDITGKKSSELNIQKLQSDLAHTARLNAMGQMSAAIAHELNQPLTAAINYVKAARRLLAPDMPGPEKMATAREALEGADTQIVRAGSIVRYLRDFVEKRESKKTSSDLNAVIRESVALGFMGQQSNDVKVILLLDEHIPPALMDKIQIQQVLINLIRNSMEAMAEVQERELTIVSSAEEAGCLHITVCDTGPGFAPEIVPKLFEPFTTTKGDGMGIGLSICRKIVEAHGGSIRLLPDGARGACFLIRLPIAPACEPKQATTHHCN
jgi:two-component system sensor kinase FixL